MPPRRVASSVSDPATRAREHVLDVHTGTVEAVLRCADAVAADWAGEATADPSAVADPLRSALDAAGVLAALPEVLAGAVRAAGFSLPAAPVAAPPYVAVTSRGPVLRATVSAGRLVAVVAAFDVERDPTRYVRGPADPERAVQVAFK